MRDRLLRILARPSVLMLMFCLSLVLFNWPLLGAAEGGTVSTAHYNLFVIWSIIVLGLWVVSRAIKATTADDSTDKGEG